MADAKRVENAYPDHGLSLPLAVEFVAHATHVIENGRRLIIGGAHDGEIETLVACLLASRDGLPARIAKFRLLRLAREAPRKVHRQASPPTEPTLDDRLLEAFVARNVTIRHPATPRELLAHAQGILHQPFLSDDGYLAAIESLDWLIGDPLHGETAFDLQVELSRRLGAGSRTPWAASWAERRAERIHGEDRRPKEDSDLIADAISFGRPEFFDQLAARRPLTQGEHAVAATAWHARAGAFHEEARRCHEKANEHFARSAKALAPEARQQWGRTLLHLADDDQAVLAAIEVLRLVPVGPNFASTLDDIAHATGRLKGDQQHAALERAIEAAWYGALADDDRVRASSTIATISKDATHPLATDALAALRLIAIETRHRRTLQRAIDASTYGPFSDEPVHDRALLEAVATALASACANLADKRDALLAAADHAIAQTARDPHADKRAKQYRSEAGRLPTHPTCSIGVPQREW